MIAKYFDVNEAGHSIRCKLYCNNPRSIREIVLFGHGFGGHKDTKAAERFAEVLLSKRKNSAVVTFNLPCHGDDVKKKLTLADCITYIRLVSGYLEKQYAPENFSVYATSFGGYLFLKYIYENPHPFYRIALRCPAVNMYDSLTSAVVKRNEMDALLQGREVPVGFDRKININKQFLEDLKESDITKNDYLELSESILILHGTKDDVVSFNGARDFADNNLIEFIPVEGADHRFQNTAHMGAAIKTIIGFLFD